jgi:proprotein convertase subtilisin/kexin type 5
MSCLSPCLTCSTSNSSCLSCTAGNYLIYGNQSCQASQCPNGQFSSLGQNICFLCSTNCATCSLTSANCTSCSLGNSGLYLYLHNDSMCYATCPTGYFGSLNPNNCTICHVSCNGCVGSSTNCINCAATYARNIGSSSCTLNCGNGYYP